MCISKAELRANKCFSELLNPQEGQSWVSMFFWKSNVPHNFLWLGPICRMSGATILQDWSVFLALWAAYQEFYMGESHKMHVSFFRGPKGRGCLWLVGTHRWQHLQGFWVPKSGAGLTRYWAENRVCFMNPFWFMSHLCCFTLDYPAPVALVQTGWWSGNNSEFHIAHELYAPEKLGYVSQNC